MKPEIIVIFGVYFAFGLLEFLRSDLFKKPTGKKGDGIVEVVSTLSLPFHYPAFYFVCCLFRNGPRHATISRRAY